MVVVGDASGDTNEITFPDAAARSCNSRIVVVGEFTFINSTSSSSLRVFDSGVGSVDGADGTVVLIDNDIVFLLLFCCGCSRSLVVLF